MDYPLICISDLLPCCAYFLSLRVDYFASAAAPASRRARATEYSVMPAATEAFSDSTMFDIGMPAMESHVSRTRRLRPLPSEPSTTTSGSVRTGFANEGVAATVKADAVVSAFLQAFNGFGEVHHAGDRHVCGCACGHLPCGCGDRSGTTFRQDHAVGAECGCGTDDCAQILRIGDAVKRDEQRTCRNACACGVGRFHGTRLLVRAFHQLGERGILERLRLHHHA